jgi:hypothetical protein
MSILSDVGAEVKAEEQAIVADIEAIMAKYEHDIIGKATYIWLELQGLVAKAKATAKAAL